MCFFFFFCSRLVHFEAVTMLHVETENTKYLSFSTVDVSNFHTKTMFDKSNGHCL